VKLGRDALKRENMVDLKFRPVYLAIGRKLRWIFSIDAGAYHFDKFACL
jgi:hypothetical protein